MKKIYSLLVLFLFCLILFGCNNKKEKIHKSPELMPIKENDKACKNLVIFIGDGMGFNHILAGSRAYNKEYEFTNWSHAYSDTFSYNPFTESYSNVTDSGAGGTAIATGVVTINSYVGKDKNGSDLATILDYAKSLGKSTGVVTTDSLVGATPADFSAHAIDRGMANEILASQLVSNIDLFIGEITESISEKRNDITASGYTYYSSFEEMENINEQNKVFAQVHFEQSGGVVTLKQATEVAVNYLSQNDNGYVLMVEAAHIDKFSHNKDFINMVKAMNSLNDSIDYVKQTDNKTGIIITADHETGGLKLSDEEEFDNFYNGVCYRFYSGSHTGSDVPVYIYGFEVIFKEFSTLDSEELVKNKDIFRIALFAITGNKYLEDKEVVW